MERKLFLLQLSFRGFQEVLPGVYAAFWGPSKSKTPGRTRLQVSRPVEWPNLFGKSQHFAGAGRAFLLTTWGLRETTNTMKTNITTRKKLALGLQSRDVRVCALPPPKKGPPKQIHNGPLPASNIGIGRTRILPVRVPSPSPILDENSASVGSEILSGAGAGV